MPLFNKYLLLDAARCGIETVEEAEGAGNQAESLFAEKNGSNPLRTVAPYLLRLDEPLMEWFLTKGWERSWGMIVVYSGEPEQTRLHLKKQLKVKNERDKRMFFRFYDPRVLRIFLPTCDKGQLKEFFGPVSFFICEDKESEPALAYCFENGQLITNNIKRDDLFNPIKLDKVLDQIMIENKR